MWNSKYYIENYNKNHNTNYEFYDNRTFGLDLYKDPCIKITDNRKFKNYINKLLPCIGKWCIDKTFNCIGSKNCYHVEHIIDVNGKEFSNPNCKQIAGNLVMSYGKWNSQLGSRSRVNYYDSMREKEIIYGIDKVESVRSIINKCNPECDILTGLSKNDIYKNDIYKITVIILGGLLLFILGLLIFYCCQICKKIYRNINSYNNSNLSIELV